MVEGFPCSRARRCGRRGKIRKGAFKTCSPTFVNSEARASDFRRDCEVEDVSTLAHFPMRLWRKNRIRRRTQRRTSLLSAALEPTGTEECGTLGIVSRKSRCVVSNSAMRSSDGLMRSETCFILAMIESAFFFSFLSGRFPRWPCCAAL